MIKINRHGNRPPTEIDASVYARVPSQAQKLKMAGNMATDFSHLVALSLCRHQDVNDAAMATILKKLEDSDLSRLPLVRKHFACLPPERQRLIPLRLLKQIANHPHAEARDVARVLISIAHHHFSKHAGADLKKSFRELRSLATCKKDCTTILRAHGAEKAELIVKYVGVIDPAMHERWGLENWRKIFGFKNGSDRHARNS